MKSLLLNETYKFLLLGSHLSLNSIAWLSIISLPCWLDCASESRLSIDVWQVNLTLFIHSFFHSLISKGRSRGGTYICYFSCMLIHPFDLSISNKKPAIKEVDLCIYICACNRNQSIQNKHQQRYFSSPTCGSANQWWGWVKWLLNNWSMFGSGCSFLSVGSNLWKSCKLLHAFLFEGNL